MMKVLFATLLTVSASIAFAGPRENFKHCAASDSSWMRRFGNYVVAFDLNSAYAACRNQSVPSTPRQTGCDLGGTWVSAGYYCEEQSGG